jgi:hypothetical protein
MIKIGIICGCLPTQYGIETSDLYHQVLSGKIEREMNQETRITSVWYTTLAGSYPNSVKMIERDKPDVIFYHVRPDPYLRVSKLWLRFMDRNGQVFNTLNLDANDSMIVDADDNVERSALRKKLRSIHRLFRTLNYMTGFILGANNAALKKVEHSIDHLIRYAGKNRIPVLIIGPASRPRSSIENQLLLRLEKKLRARFAHENYISCFGVRDEKGNILFMKDGIHVNKTGHSRFSELIFPVLKEILIKQPVY